MQVSLNVLMGRGYDATPSIAIIINKSTYLINAPPLIYRLCIQNGIKLKTISGIFITSHNTYGCGGLQSFYESMKTCSAKYSIFAPADITEYLCHNNAIVDQDSLVQIISSTPEFESLPTLKVTSIEMSNSVSYKVNIDLDDLKFNQAKMKELGLPPGSWISNVRKFGEAVVNGNVVKKEDIFFIQHSHFELLFLDIQDKCDLLKLPSQEEMDKLDVIVHFTPPELFDDDYFSHFQKVKNYCFLNDAIVCLKESFEFYENFTNFDSSLFPPLPQGHIKTHQNLPSNFLSLFSGSILYTNKNFELKQIQSIPIVSCELPRFSIFAFTVIGSCGAYECPKKGCSGYLLHTHQGFVIIDCGNGYLQQLCRKYGPENLEFIMKNLKCIWLSHCHFDHLFGIYDILLYHKKVTGEKLLVCCDPISMSEIENKAAVYGKGDKNFFNLTFNDRKESIQICDVVIQSIETTHCQFSMGCVITFKDGFKIAYTSDMLNDGKFKSAVIHCDLLISEATYTQAKEDRCQVYFHMTNRQAEELQLSLGAKYLIMVHTSNCYSPDDFVTNNENAIYGFDYLCFTNDNIQRVFAANEKVKAKY